jgi:hypothetical protein
VRAGAIADGGGESGASFGVASLLGSFERETVCTRSQTRQAAESRELEGHAGHVHSRTPATNFGCGTRANTNSTTTTTTTTARERRHASPRGEGAARPEHERNSFLVQAVMA